MKVLCRVLESNLEKLSHLDKGQRAELVEVLDEFTACFSDKPGLCDVVTHRIVTTSQSPGLSEKQAANSSSTSTSSAR